MRRSVSFYSDESYDKTGNVVIHENNREFFAESFTDYIQNENKTNPISRDLMSEFFKLIRANRWYL